MQTETSRLIHLGFENKSDFFLPQKEVHAFKRHSHPSLNKLGLPLNSLYKLMLQHCLMIGILFNSKCKFEIVFYHVFSLGRLQMNTIPYTGEASQFKSQCAIVGE